METKKVINEIQKSPADKRKYRAFVLENQLEVLVISDEATDKSAASLVVKVGSLNNPPEIPGLAHFLEHMLFLGTEKYPNENEYQTYVKEHGGSNNAYTDFDVTNYHFDISPNYLEGALDRFAQFFICPTFEESATEREINAVNSEFEKDKGQDSWRMMQFNQSISNPKHPYHRFVIGNTKTLKEMPAAANIDVRAALLDFHKKYYSANIMKLAVLGKESLDELESMTRKLFSAIPNRNAPNRFLGYGEAVAFPKEILPQYWNIVPAKDLHNLKVYWPIEPVHLNWKSKPDRLIAHLLGHEAAGSLLALLKKKSWAVQLVAGITDKLDDFALFTCTIALTEEGTSHIYEIITMIYQYLDLLKKTGIQKWIFDEVQGIFESQWTFLEDAKPGSYTKALALNLHLYPPEAVLSGPIRYFEFDQKLTESVLHCLTPNNMILQFVSKKIAHTVDSKEPWFGTEYSKQEFPPGMLEKWSNPEPNPELHLPQPNPFLSTDFTLKKEESTEYPVKIMDTKMWEVWHKFDTTFNRPKAQFLFLMISPEAYASPLNIALTTLYVQACWDALNEKYTYFAELAGLLFSMTHSFDGIHLDVSGFNQNLPVLIKKIFKKIAHLKINEERINFLKEQLCRDYDNAKMQQPYIQANEYARACLYDRSWSNEQRLEALKEATVETLKEFIPRLLNSLSIQMLVQGNFTKQEVFALTSDIDSILKAKPLLPEQIPERRLLKLHKGSTSIYRDVNTNPIDSNRCVWLQFQIGRRNTRDDVLLELMSQFMHTPFYDQLRTKEQLGYGLWSFAQYHLGVGVFNCVIQSPHKEPEYLVERIEAFLQSFTENLTTLTDEDWKSNVDALKTVKLQKPLKLSQECSINWPEIANRYYQFDRRKKFVECLETITKDELLQFYKSKITNHDSRKLYIAQIYAPNTTIPPVNGADSKTKYVTKGEEYLFKAAHGLYPACR